MNSILRALAVFSMCLFCLTPVLVYSKEKGNKDRPLFRWVVHDRFGDHVTYSDLPPINGYKSGVKGGVEVVSAEISSVFKEEKSDGEEEKGRKVLELIKESGISIDSEEDYGSSRPKTSYVGRILPGGSISSARGMV
ncbi:hypothetical protein [Candidatus Ichthyocystis hellenicum]|uniref:hypothetical protein n=1 Tax=Candidatus Ichthyocystis hellenicum TaxID=1561003 RepID=UPI000B844F22|nr:hypothetical protein [Candidatus Ichthyocystis hellenicum]